MKKRVIVVSGLSLAVFARRILCWQDEAISHTVAVTWLLCNRRCSVERSATFYSSARLHHRIRILRRRRRDVRQLAHLGRALWMPRGARTDQTELRPRACQLNRIRELSHTEPK